MFYIQRTALYYCRLLTSILLMYIVSLASSKEIQIYTKPSFITKMIWPLQKKQWSLLNWMILFMALGWNTQQVKRADKSTPVMQHLLEGINKSLPYWSWFNTYLLQFSHLAHEDASSEEYRCVHGQSPTQCPQGNLREVKDLNTQTYAFESTTT